MGVFFAVNRSQLSISVLNQGARLSLVIIFKSHSGPLRRAGKANLVSRISSPSILLHVVLQGAENDGGKASAVCIQHTCRLVNLYRIRNSLSPSRKRSGLAGISSGRVRKPRESPTSTATLNQNVVRLVFLLHKQKKKNTNLSIIFLVYL